MEGPLMPELEKLTLLVRQLEDSFRLWNRWAIFFTAATAFVAVGYFVTSLIANHKAEQLNKAQTKLIAEKDRISQLDIQKLQTEEQALRTQQENAHEEIAKAQAAAAEANLKAAELTAKTEKTNQFVAGLAEQQQGMAKQIQGVPTLGDQQIAIIADRLKPFAGQQITIRATTDTTVLRLGGAFKKAFLLAGLNVIAYDVDMGAQYQGVTVVVKFPTHHPPLADALLNAIRDVGIHANGASTLEPISNADVTIYLGPQ
jgi:hypothetical protein